MRRRSLPFHLYDDGIFIQSFPSFESAQFFLLSHLSSYKIPYIVHLVLYDFKDNPVPLNKVE